MCFCLYYYYYYMYWIYHIDRIVNSMSVYKTIKK